MLDDRDRVPRRAGGKVFDQRVDKTIRKLGQELRAHRAAPRDLIFSGVFERHPRLTLAIVEFELAWGAAPALQLGTTYTAIATARRSTGSRTACCRAAPSAATSCCASRRTSSGLGLSESTFPQSRKILAEIRAGVPEDEQAKIAGGNTVRMYNSTGQG
jgi:hypothetical protein